MLTLGRTAQRGHYSPFASGGPAGTRGPRAVRAAPSAPGGRGRDGDGDGDRDGVRDGVRESRGPPVALRSGQADWPPVTAWKRRISPLPHQYRAFEIFFTELVIVKDCYLTEGFSFCFPDY